MAALAVPAGERGKEGRFAVPLLVEVEGNRFLAGSSGDVRRLEIYAYAMGTDGAVNDFLAEALSLDLAQVGEAVLEGGIKFAGTLSLPPGPASIRVLVVDPDTLRYSLRVLSLTVAEGNAGPLLLQPLFSDPRQRWMLVRSPDPENTGKLDRSLAPLLVDEGWGLPAALPVLAGGRSRRVTLLGRALPAEAVVSLELRSEPAGGVHSIPGRVVERSRISASALERLVCDFDLPKLETGRYRAVVSLAQGSSRIETPELAALYLGDSPLTEEILWAQLRRLGGETTAPAPSQETEPKGRRRNKELEEIARRSYREAIRALASGSPVDQVVTQLAGAETVWARQAPHAVGDLQEIEREAAEQLGREDREILVPLSVLHAELYRSLREQKEYLLAENARRTSAALATLYAKRGGSGSIAAQTLLSLAADLLSSGVQSASRALLDQALALDGRSEAVGLFLATSYERSGDFPKAIEVLEPLVQAHPVIAEARLRLGINLGRIEKTAEAREILRRLLAEPGPQWVQTVAYEELARIHLREKRPQDAIALLRQGVSRLPDQTQLAVQLAYLLERQGSAVSAREMLAHVKARSPGAGETPRHRYGQWPAASLEEARRSLTQQSILRLAALARALEVPARGGR